MALRRFLILYLIGLAICGLVAGISYAVTKVFGLPNDLPVVLVIFVPALILGIAAALNVGGYFASRFAGPS